MTVLRTTTDLTTLLIHDNLTLKEAMAAIDSGGIGIVLLVDHAGRLIRTITDGDLRRAILAGHGITARLAVSVNLAGVSSVTAPATASTDEQMQIMLKAEVRHLPLLNSDGTVFGISCLQATPGESLEVQAVIMAGGFGTRLRPLTDHTPKPMLSVGGKPLMQRTIENLQKAGVQNISVTTHFMPEIIRQHFGEGRRFGVALNYVAEEQPQGTAGALRMLTATDEPLLVMNGDILTNIDFRKLVRFHKERKASLTVAVRQFEMQVPYGVIEARDGVVSELREKPQLMFLVNAGIYLLEPRVLRHIPAEGRYDMTDLISCLIQNGEPVVGFPVMEYWLDIGRHDDFQKAQEDVESVRWAA
ncbi:MAG: nucleotidyltransferase family protein [Planctomyces sp.]|jgi:dTDP-glucose pyrophosphorylase